MKLANFLTVSSMFTVWNKFLFSIYSYIMLCMYRLPSAFSIQRTVFLLVMGPSEIAVYHVVMV